MYIDLVNYLEKYVNKITYPLPLLEDFVANDYKSIEQKRFDKQIEENERHHKGFICVDTVFFDRNLCFSVVSLLQKKVRRCSFAGARPACMNFRRRCMIIRQWGRAATGCLCWLSMSYVFWHAFCFIESGCLCPKNETNHETDLLCHSDFAARTRLERHQDGFTHAGAFCRYPAVCPRGVRTELLQFPAPPRRALCGVPERI